jgi:hypothetical protein
MNRCWLCLCGALAACSTSSSHPSANGGPTSVAFSGVVTNRYDDHRTGAQTSEAALTPAVLSGGHFGLLFSRPVDGTIQAQPLYLPGVQFADKAHNAVFVATEHDTVYAFDADDPAAAMPLWMHSLGSSMVATMATWGCTDLVPEVGVSATPVIDPASGTLYVLSQQDGTTHKLHALDVTTGAEKLGGPVEVSPPMAGWDPSNLFSRVGLLLNNGTIYAAFASHCDYKPYRGWVFAFDAQTLMLKATYATGATGGIWQSGMGLSTDGNGGIFFVAGVSNHAIDYGLAPDGGPEGGPPPLPPCSGSNVCQSVGRLTLGGGMFNLTGSYTPSNVHNSQAHDLDLATAVVIGGNLGFVSGKDGVVHVLDPGTLNWMQDVTVYLQPDGGPATGGKGHVHGGPVYWDGPSGPMLYVWPEQGALQAYSVTSSGLNTTPVARNANLMPFHPGAITTLSSNGKTPHTGILWAATMTNPMDDAWHTIVPGTLYAFDAEDITHMLWSSDMNPGDKLGAFAKFCAPTVANGKVYLGTATSAPLGDGGVANGVGMGTLQVYGMK